MQVFKKNASSEIYTPPKFANLVMGAAQTLMGFSSFSMLLMIMPALIIP